MTTTRDQTTADVLDFLKGSPGGGTHTMKEISQAVGVHQLVAHMATKSLISKGLVARTLLKAKGRGRPPYVYKATEAAAEQ